MICDLFYVTGEYSSINCLQRLTKKYHDEIAKNAHITNAIFDAADLRGLTQKDRLEFDRLIETGSSHHELLQDPEHLEVESHALVNEPSSPQKKSDLTEISSPPVGQVHSMELRSAEKKRNAVDESTSINCYERLATQFSEALAISFDIRSVTFNAFDLSGLDDKDRESFFNLLKTGNIDDKGVWRSKGKREALSGTTIPGRRCVCPNNGSNENQAGNYSKLSFEHLIYIWVLGSNKGKINNSKPSPRVDCKVSFTLFENSLQFYGGSHVPLCGKSNSKVRKDYIKQMDPVVRQNVIVDVNELKSSKISFDNVDARAQIATTLRKHGIEEKDISKGTYSSLIRACDKVENGGKKDTLVEFKNYFERMGAL